MRTMSRWADRLLERVAPHATARATDCEYQCCRADYWRYCCYYPNGNSYCGSCITSYDARKWC